MQSVGGFVEIGKAGGQAGDRLTRIEEGVDTIDGFDQNVVDADRSAGLGPRFGDLEDQALGFVENFFAGTPLWRVGAVGDLVADADQLAQCGALANDLRVGLDVRHRRRVLRQLTEIGQAADLRQVPFLVQLLGQGDHVERRVALGQGEDGTEDEAMIVAIEIAIGYLIEHALPGIVVQHQAAKHRLLCLDGVRRYLERCGFQIVLLGDTDVVHGTRNSKLQKNKGHVPLAWKRARCYSSGTSGARRWLSRLRRSA